MERNARFLTAFVGLTALVVVSHLLAVPYGVDGWWWRRTVGDRRGSDDATTNEPRVDSTVMTGLRGSSPTFVDSVSPSPSDAARSHFTELHAAKRVVTLEELTTLGDSVTNIHAAIRILRPYWLHEMLDAKAMIGGQLLGGTDQLRTVSTSRVRLIRLDFSSEQPHWVVRVFMR